MSERIWLKNYPPGVPADIDPGQYNSLAELIAEALAQHADHKAYVLMDHALTYRDVDQMAAAFAAFHRYPQELINVPVARQPDLASVPAIAARMAAIERELGDDGRLLLRYSGTEPKCRVMIESADAERTHRLCRELADLVRRELGA